MRVRSQSVGRFPRRTLGRAEVETRHVTSSVRSFVPVASYDSDRDRRQTLRRGANIIVGECVLYHVKQCNVLFLDAEDLSFQPGSILYVSFE
jgi:hypothetical protein